MQVARRGPGRPLRWMAVQDRIRLTGLLREEPPQGGSSYRREGYPFAPGIRAKCGKGFRSVRARTPLARCDAECEHVFALIVCALIPRFELAVAAGGREHLAAGPVALAPEPGREQFIGEVSAAAEAHGVRAGLRLGEALARCPTLRLVAPDPAAVADEWERLLAALENVGAAVEPGRPGLAWFDSRGLRNLHGGSVEGVIAAARRALGTPARLGAAPSRFAALAAASHARIRRAEIAPDKRLAAYLAPLPVDLLSNRPETAALPITLERFGIHTLGELAALPKAALADRFGSCRPAGQGPRKRQGLPAEAPSPRREPGGAARAAGVGLRPAARARARPADRPAARPPRAPRPLDARRHPRRQAGRGRELAHARDLPRGAGRPAADAARARAPPGRAARARRRPPAQSRGPRPPAGGPALAAVRARRRSAPPACARPSARRAPPRGPTRRCASWRSIPIRECPSAAWR